MIVVSIKSTKPPRPVAVYQHPSYAGAEEAKAKARGITVEEYRARVIQVRKAANECKWQVGMVGIPYYKKDQKTYGQCRILSVCRHYDDYGTVAWNEGVPFIMQVMSLTTQQAFACSGGWLVLEHEKEGYVPVPSC